MVVDPNGVQPVAGDPSDSSPKPAVQFSPSNQGLLGGDMHLSRNSNSASPPYGVAQPIPMGLPAPSSAALPSSSNVIPTPIGPPLDENNHHYVGLVNQAMTCYLNSLIQSLYMTPEFRNAIYKWEYKSGKGSSENSIPCQIQKLFLLLQTSECSALETKDLTASFGWNSNEAYDQHDVQELCRLMFDALEVKWKNSPHDKLIQTLYQGSMQDFVKCLKCGKENVRQDYFLDLPLALKPFGAVESYKSIEEALSAFVSPELLNGSNQYHCENCNSKQDAHKGLRVTNFPYLLTIQLKRFDFDYNTMHRIKLNDKMTFPDILDLNSYVYDPNNPTRCETHPNIDPDSVVVGEPINTPYVDEMLSKNGSFVYELFSVMVHQGSAAGGHYYAYIKNMDQDKWYLFNDSRVEATTSAEIQRSFGGSHGGWSGSNTNAYMLMYRQIDRQKNDPFIRSPELPQHILKLKQQWKIQEEEKEKNKQYLLSLVTITVHLNIPCDVEFPTTEHKMQIPRSMPISSLFSLAVSFFSDEGKKINVPISKGSSRLIMLEGNNMREVFVSRSDMDRTIESCIYNCYNSTFDLKFLLDVRTANHFFDVGPGRTISVQRVDIAKRVVRPPFLLCITNNAPEVLRVKQIIGTTLGEESHSFVSARLVLEKGDNSMNKMCMMDLPKKNFIQELTDCYMTIPTVYYDGEKSISEIVEMDRKKSLHESLMFEILDRKKFALLLRIKLPTDEEINRAASAYSACTGLSWSESMSLRENSPSKQEDSKPVADLPDVPSVGSLRGSSPSSLISDDGSMVMGTGSVCQNTPQMSPNVSENGEADEGIGSDIMSNIADPSSYLHQTINSYDVNMSSLETDSGSGSTLVPSNNCNRQIIVKGKDSNNIYTYDVDNRLTVGELKKWIAEQLKTDSAQFVIFRHQQDDITDKGYETSPSDDEPIHTAFKGFNWLSITLRPPLRDDEKLIKIVQFDTEEPNRDNWKHLFDIPASKKTQAGDILLRCQRMYQELYGTALELNRIRLRDMAPTAVSKPVLNPKNALDQRAHCWNQIIYLHILTDEKVINVAGDPVFVRRFRPSTVEVGPIHEVMVKPQQGCNMQCVRKSISEYSGIPFERVEVTEPPTSSWDVTVKWPYLKSRLELLDGNIKFVKELPHDFLDKIGHRVLYYRDSIEIKKEITDEERKQITIKDNTSSPSTVMCRRKERPLRIQLSSVSES